MYGNLTFWSVTLTEENKAVIVVLVKRIIKLTYFCPIYVIDVCHCIIFLYTWETERWEKSACACMHIRVPRKSRNDFVFLFSTYIINSKWNITNVWVRFHLFRQGRTRGFLVMAVIADPLCSLPSLCQRLGEQNVCMDEGERNHFLCLAFLCLCYSLWSSVYASVSHVQRMLNMSISIKTLQHRIGWTSDGLCSLFCVLCFLNSRYLDHSNTLIHSDVALGKIQTSEPWNPVYSRCPNYLI